MQATCLSDTLIKTFYFLLSTNRKSSCTKVNIGKCNCTHFKQKVYAKSTQLFQAYNFEISYAPFDLHFTK